MATMRAFVVDAVPSEGNGSPARAKGGVQSVSRPVPAPGEALVRVLRAGICNTDIEIMAGYMGFHGILGHEFVGVVEEVADNDSSSRHTGPSHQDLVGKRVCGEINVACCRPTCNTCRSGGDRARNHCPSRSVLGILNRPGTYAQYLALPARNLHVVPDHISDRQAVFAEPLAAACRIMEQGLVKSSDRVAVLGDGKLGLLCCEVLGRQGLRYRPTLLGRHKAKMELVKDVVDTLDASAGAEDPKLAAVFDVVVDATGTPGGLEAANRFCRPLGTIVLKSTCAMPSGFNTAPFVIDEKAVIGSRCGPFEQALALLDDGNIDVTKYITAEYPLEEAGAALEAAKQKGGIKFQLVCN